MVRTKCVNIMEYHDMGYANAGMFLALPDVGRF
jgi:hypothetical protein